MEKQEYIEAGRISNTHGVAGEVKIEVWLDSPDFLKNLLRTGSIIKIFFLLFHPL